MKSVLREGFLSAEGILADFIYIQSDLDLFDECIFMVQLQRQYCASSELERYLSTFVTDPDEEQDDSTTKYIKALEVSLIIIYFFTFSLFHFYILPVQ